MPGSVLILVDPELKGVDSVYTTWCLTYSVMQCAQIVDLIISVYPRYLKQKHFYKKKKDLIELTKKFNSLPADYEHREEVEEKLHKL